MGKIFLLHLEDPCLLDSLEEYILPMVYAQLACVPATYSYNFCGEPSARSAPFSEERHLLLPA